MSVFSLGCVEVSDAGIGPPDSPGVLTLGRGEDAAR